MQQDYFHIATFAGARSLRKRLHRSGELPVVRLSVDGRISYARPMLIGQRLRDIREARDLSQGDLEIIDWPGAPLHFSREHPKPLNLSSRHDAKPLSSATRDPAGRVIVAGHPG